MEPKDIIDTSSNRKSISTIIEEHPMLVPLTLGILGLVWLGNKALNKGRNFILKFGKDGMSFESNQDSSDTNSSSGVS